MAIGGSPERSLPPAAARFLAGSVSLVIVSSRHGLLGSTRRSFGDGLVLRLLGTGLPRRFCGLCVFSGLRWGRLGWSGLGDRNDLFGLVCLLGPRSAALRLRFRRGFAFGDRRLFLDRALDHG